MTIEQKANAYDEALKVIKSNLDALNEITTTGAEAVNVQAIKNCFYKAFPELKGGEDDSEDERTRKAILSFIRHSPDTRKLPTREYSKWIEYLEKQKKQKEQKPAHTAKEMWKEMRLEVYAQASGNRHEPNYSDDSTKMFSLCDIDEIFEKIGNSTVEPKPAEWSKEDEDMYARIVRRYTDYEGVIMRTKEESVAAKILDAMAQEEIWLKSLLKRFNLQLEQKWSKEDERMLRLIINAFKEGAMSTIKQDQWLKSLPERFNLQPQTQPKQEQNPEAKLTGWVARDRNGEISVYEDYPERISAQQFWFGQGGSRILDQKSFPDLKWEDEPTKVEIIIRKK